MFTYDTYLGYFIKRRKQLNHRVSLLHQSKHRLLWKFLHHIHICEENYIYFYFRITFKASHMYVIPIRLDPSLHPQVSFQHSYHSLKLLKICLQFNTTLYKVLIAQLCSGHSFFMLLRRANAIKVWANAIIFRKQRNKCCCLSIFSLNNVLYCEISHHVQLEENLLVILRAFIIN